MGWRRASNKNPHHSINYALYRRNNDPQAVMNGFLRLPDVLKLIPVCKATWWKWVASGKAPQPIKLSPRVTVWREAEIKKFIEGFE